MRYKHLLKLAEIGAKRELEKALCEYQILSVKSDNVEVVDYCDYESACMAVHKATEDYTELIKLIKAQESF